MLKNSYQNALALNFAG